MRALRLLTAAVATAAVAAAAPAAVQAHQGNPQYLSVVRGVVPAVPGLAVVMLNRNDRLQVTYRGGTAPVTFPGYEGEPYLRFLPNGVVQRNAYSPSTYLNADATGTAPVPAVADAKKPPRWETVSEDGMYQFHDHRIHWMGQSRPPIVKDPDKRTKVDDWRVPFASAGRTGAIVGTLYWTPLGGGGVPVAAIVGLAVLVIGGAALVVVVRRRREPLEDGDDPDTPARPEREAW